MLMRKEEHWICINPFCGGNATVQIAYYSREDPPRCACGGALRLGTASRTFTYLDFLRPAQTELPHKPQEEE